MLRLGRKETFRKWKDFPMAPFLIVLLIFFAGFASGYAVRSSRSQKRKYMRQLYAPYGSSGSRPPTRRAF